MSIWFSVSRPAGRLLPGLVIALVALLVAVAAAAPWHSGAAPDETGDDLAAIWESHLSATGVPGGGYAVVSPTATQVHTAGRDGAGQAWSARTPGLWGSLAKPLAASVADAVVREGRLRLDAPVGDLVSLPGCPHATRAITARDLLRHTSGIGPGLAALDEGRDTSATAVVQAEGAALCPSGPPGRYAYSSANYLLLAATLEAATGEDYGTLLRRHVGSAVGADTLVTSTDRSAAAPQGHRYVAGQAAPVATPFDASGLAYGYVGGSLTDLAAIARGYLGTRPALGSPRRDAGVATPSGERYGLGWRLHAQSDGSVVAWHSGMVPGYVATIMVWPERDLALVTMQNASGVLHAESLLSGPLRLAAAVGPGGAPWPSPDAPRGVDPVYPVALGVATAVAGTIWWLALRPGPRAPRRRRMWGWAAAATLFGGLVAAGLWWSGVPLRQAWLWLPDVTVAVALAGLAIVVGLARACLAPNAKLQHGPHRREPVTTSSR